MVWKTVIGSKQANCYIGNVVGGVAPCITSACGSGGGMVPMLTNVDAGHTTYVIIRK